MLVVGLTGGIGSGKSVIADLFAQHSVPIIDADIVAHEVTEPSHPAFASIIKHFGQEIVGSDGKLNRAKLRQIVFDDPNQRLWLESLLHPIIRDEMERQIQALTVPYCIAVIPLLFEVEFYYFINRVLVVDTPEHLQIERVTKRDKFSQEEVQAILKAQATREARVARAQDVIINDGKLDDLKPQVEKLHHLYLELSKQKTN